MIYFGQRESAETMFNWGYVTFLAEDDKFEELVHEKASWLGNAPTTSLAMIKKAVKFGTQVPLDVGLQLEQLGFAVNSSSPDIQEGIKAFLQKRETKFTGGM